MSGRVPACGGRSGRRYPQASATWDSSSLWITPSAPRKQGPILALVRLQDAARNAYKARDAALGGWTENPRAEASDATAGHFRRRTGYRPRSGPWSLSLLW